MKITTLAFNVLLSFMVLPISAVFAQAVKPTIESIDDTVVDREHVQWPSPEALLSNLRSEKVETRLKALTLAGLNDQQAHEAIWSDGRSEPAKVIGRTVVAPLRTQLMYGSIGEDSAQQSIS